MVTPEHSMASSEGINPGNVWGSNPLSSTINMQVTPHKPRSARSYGTSHGTNCYSLFGQRG